LKKTSIIKVTYRPLYRKVHYGKQQLLNINCCVSWKIEGTILVWNNHILNEMHKSLIWGGM